MCYTLTLIWHTSKIMLHIIHVILKHLSSSRNYWRRTMRFYLWKRNEGADQDVRQVIKKTREFSPTAYLYFVDYDKTFDSVLYHFHGFLQSFDVLQHLIFLIKSLLDNNFATVMVNETFSAVFKIEASTSQGCILCHRSSVLTLSWKSGITAKEEYQLKGKNFIINGMWKIFLCCEKLLRSWEPSWNDKANKLVVWSKK